MSDFATDVDVNVADYTEQIINLLWPGMPATAGTQPRSGGLLALPNARQARLLVPAHQRRTAASAVRRYNVQPDARARLKTAVLAAGLQSGLMQPLARRRSWLPTGGGEPGGITALLRDIVSPHCEIAIYVGLPRGNRKPVLLVMEPDGSLAAVAKLGVSPLSRRLIRNESEALRRLSTASLSVIRVPDVLFSGEWRGTELLVQSALPEAGKKPADSDHRTQLAAVEISRLDGVESQRLESSPVLSDLSQRLEPLPAGAERELAARSLSQLRDAAPGLELPVGSWHGDWTPWNLAATRNDGFLVWDWERFATGVPIGYDALHFSGQLRAGMPGGPAAGLDAIRAELPSILAPFGVASDAREAVFALYLIELLVRYTEDEQARMPIGRRWVDALTGCLSSLMAGLAQSPQQRKAL